MKKILKIKSPVNYVFNDEREEGWWYADLEDLFVKADRVCRVKHLEKVGKALILPSQAELYEYSELVKAFEEETGIKILEKNVGAYLRAIGLYERFAVFRRDFMSGKFQSWCKENHIVIE